MTDVKQLALDNKEFTVIDTKSDEDLIRSILLQIILEEESNGMPMFSSTTLYWTEAGRTLTKFDCIGRREAIAL